MPDSLKDTNSRVCPNPQCGHATPHEDEVVYCEVEGCDCDRTSVDNFYADEKRTEATFSAERLRQFARELHNAAHNNQTREPDPYGEALDWSADEIERLRSECCDKAGVLKHLDWTFITRTRAVVQQVADFLEGLANG